MFLCIFIKFEDGMKLLNNFSFVMGDEKLCLLHLEHDLIQLHAEI